MLQGAESESEGMGLMKTDCCIVYHDRCEGRAYSMPL